MTLATDIENAFARYLTNESDEGALPDAGYIVCAVDDSEIVQPIINANWFQAMAFVRLVYPSDDYASDSDTIASFRAAEGELERLMCRDDIAEELTKQGEGVAVVGIYDGLRFATAINGRQRVAEWRMALNVHAVVKVV
jgi:hypothetical protein